MKNHALRRIGLLSVLLIVLTDVILALTMSVLTFNLATESCKAKAENFREAMSHPLPGLDIDDLDNNEITRSGFQEYMRSLFGFSNAKYMYLFRASREEDTITYILTVAADDEENRKISEERSMGTVVDIGERSFIDHALDGELTGPEIEINQFGEVLAYYFPLSETGSSQNVIVGIDFDITKNRQKTTRYVVLIVLIVNIVLITVLGLLLLILRKKVFIPIKKLAVEMNNLDPEQKHEPLKFHTYQEIEEITRSFDQMSEDIIGYIDNLRTMTEERSHAAAELNIARRIQIGMVPQRFTLSGDGYEISAFAEPAREVGGDFYDCFELNGKVWIVIADVSGKGIAAALFMAMIKNMLREKLRAGASLAAALNEVNDEICTVNPENMFVTVFAAMLNPSTGELRYANAGHTRPLMICGDKKSYLTPNPGIVLGLFEDAGIIEEHTMLDAGCSFLIYTDGVTEALNPQRELFGEQRLQAAAAGGRAEQTVASVTDAVRAYAAGCEQSDDITLVAVQFTPCEGNAAGYEHS
ncbi:MAG: serine/threonine-protein phosphatase [Oscillospiraceae bacterium]|nr:serine/threonine-protein phosphatase [Oscillospiraceae bacterium]